MEWLSTEELSQFAATNDLIEFRTRSFGFLRKKRWARVICIEVNDTHLPLVEQIQVIEVRTPNSKVRFNSETQSLAKLMDGKVGRYLNKSVQINGKTQKKGVFDKIVSFFNGLIDRVQDFFHTLSAKVEEFHEEKLSKWGYKFRRFGWHLLVFAIEAVIGITIILAIVAAVMVIFWWFALAFACLMALITPTAPLVVPLSLII